MGLLQFSVCFILLLSWISIASGLQCPSCTYLTTDANIPATVRSIIEAILGLFQDEECVNDLEGLIPETCETIAGQVPRCSIYDGSLTLTIPLLVTSVDIPLKIFQRGCDHFKTANVPATGCHNPGDINEDKTLVQQFLNKVSTALEDYEVANFQGKICLCTDTYCKETSGANHSALTNSFLFVLSALVCLINLYVN